MGRQGEDFQIWLMMRISASFSSLLPTSTILLNRKTIADVLHLVAVWILCQFE